jgi:Ni2+-binding GTPase involved in maturation of urease and hydrogenase
MASAEEKNLQVLGAPGSGKATLIGNLLFKVRTSVSRLILNIADLRSAEQ